MRSSRPSSSPYFFIMMFIMMSIQTSSCAGNEQYVNCNRRFLCATFQTLHPILRFTVLPPQLAVPSRQLAAEERSNPVTYGSTQCSKGSVPSYQCSSTKELNAPATQPTVPSGVPVSSQSPSTTPSIVPAPQPIVPSAVPDLGSSPAPPPIEPSTGPGKSSLWLKIAIGISVAVVGIVVISFVIIYSVKRGHFSSGAKNYHINDEEVFKEYGSIAPKRYTYSDVKKMTNSFKDKVGQGGYGVVYKGKLLDGCTVAVKILSASKGNGEEFINEVTSISRTSHVNVVTLLGFCHGRTKRALIYEFMPNGSLDKFIYDKGSPITNCHLDSKTMFQIVVGIARGLEYLHRGCNTRILHFDIKPHNILLDEDLCPKIFDFGLAKLCKTKECIVSMTGMRGTVGFIAPKCFVGTLVESLTSLMFTVMECWFLKWLEEEKILIVNSLIPARHIFHIGFIRSLNKA